MKVLHFISNLMEKTISYWYYLYRQFQVKFRFFFSIAYLQKIYKHLKKKKRKVEQSSSATEFTFWNENE